MKAILIIFLPMAIVFVLSIHSILFYFRNKTYGIQSSIGLIVSAIFPFVVLGGEFFICILISKLSMVKMILGLFIYVVVSVCFYIFINAMIKYNKEEDQEIDNCLFCHKEVEPIRNKLNICLHLPIVFLTGFTWIIGVIILFLKNQKTWKCPECGKVNQTTDTPVLIGNQSQAENNTEDKTTDIEIMLKELGELKNQNDNPKNFFLRNEESFSKKEVFQERCNIEAFDDILALIDTTLFKSCKDGLAFCKDRIVIKNAFEEAQSITYNELLNAKFKLTDDELYINAIRFKMISSDIQLLAVKEGIQHIASFWYNHLAELTEDEKIINQLLSDRPIPDREIFEDISQDLQKLTARTKYKELGGYCFKYLRDAMWLTAFKMNDSNDFLSIFKHDELIFELLIYITAISHLDIESLKQPIYEKILIPYLNRQKDFSILFAPEVNGTINMLDDSSEKLSFIIKLFEARVATYADKEQSMKLFWGNIILTIQSLYLKSHPKTSTDDLKRLSDYLETSSFHTLVMKYPEILQRRISPRETIYLRYLQNKS